MIKQDIQAFIDRLLGRTKKISGEVNKKNVEQSKKYTREEYRERHKNEAIISKAFDTLSDKFDKYRYVYKAPVVITRKERKMLNRFRDNGQIIKDITIRMIQRIGVPIYRN